jgi:hypothetical protein
MLLDQQRATAGIPAWHRCRWTDKNLDRPIGQNAEETEAEATGEIAESRVVFPSLAAR